MSYLHVKLKTPKTIPSWAVCTLLGQIRERPPSPPPNPRWELPLPVWMWLAFCQGLCMVLIQANSYPTLSMPRWELLLPVGMLLPICANAPLHLPPPPPSRRGELPVLYRGFVSHPQPPRRVSPFCIDVAYMLRLSPGAAHGVDSSELAFRLAAIGAMREGKGHHVRSQGHSK